VRGYDGVPSRCTTVVMLEKDSGIGTLYEASLRGFGFAFGEVFLTRDVLKRLMKMGVEGVER
jgi:hypothetical protein